MACFTLVLELWTEYELHSGSICTHGVEGLQGGHANHNALRDLFCMCTSEANCSKFGLLARGRNSSMPCVVLDEHNGAAQDNVPLGTTGFEFQWQCRWRIWPCLVSDWLAGGLSEQTQPTTRFACSNGHECYRLGNDCIQFKLSHKPGVAGLNCGG